MERYPFYGLLSLLFSIHVFKATLYYHRLRPDHLQFSADFSRNFCKHQEYLERLRDEASEMTEDEICGFRDHDTPLLDRFLNETARLFPDQAIVMQRKVLDAFTFNDGTYVPAGNKVCVAQQAMMSDPANYEDPASFQGFCFANGDGGIPTSTSRLSHPSADFTLWGSARYPCPARFYVSMITKMIMAHLITTYDIKLANEGVNPSVSLGPTVLTHPRLILLTQPDERIIRGSTSLRFIRSLKSQRTKYGMANDSTRRRFSSVLKSLHTILQPMSLNS